MLHAKFRGGNRRVGGCFAQGREGSDSIYLTTHESMSGFRTKVIFRIKMESKFVKKCLMDETMV